MYIPANCLSLDKAAEPQRRIGIQGYSGTGKTWAALTFPNTVVLNLDRGLGAHTGRSDVIEAPFWNEAFCKKVNPNYKDKSHLFHTVINWIRTEGAKLTAEQHLVFDGLTSTQNAYHSWYAVNPVYTKSGKEDDFAEWRLKINQFGEICELLKSLTCSVILIAHESEKKEKDGTYSGKIRPLLNGQFSDQIVNYFTDWFRQHSMNKIPIEKVDAKVLANWGCKTPGDFMALQAIFPRQTMYYWQTESDDIFDAKASSLINFPRYIPATYNNFLAYSKTLSIVGKG